MSKISTNSFDTVNQSVQLLLANKEKLFGPESSAMSKLGIVVCCIVMECKKCEVYTVDSGFDTSSYARSTTEGFLPEDYEGLTVEEFLNSQYTGNSVPTFTSGSGLCAESWSDAVTTVIYETWHETIKTVFPDIALLIDEDEFDIYDKLFAAGLDEISLTSSFYALEMTSVMAKWGKQAEAEILGDKLKRMRQEKQKQAYELYLKEVAGNLPDAIRDFCAGRKFDKSNWNDLLIFLNNFEKKQVGATLHIYQPYCSNSVAEELSKTYPAPAIPSDH